MLERSRTIAAESVGIDFIDVGFRNYHSELSSPSL